MAYRYDIFISYKRRPEIVEWLDQIFIRLLDKYLTEELGYQPNLFVDREEIDYGEQWVERLKEGLKHSKTLVPIYTAEYFQSDWCIREHNYFTSRLDKLKMKQINYDMIIPVRLGDGAHYPKSVYGYQMTDLRDFYQSGKAFVESPKFLQLEENVKKFATALAEKILEIKIFEETAIDLLNLPEDENFIAKVNIPQAVAAPKLY